MICNLFPEPVYFFFSSGMPVLLFYSHIPTAAITLLVGLIVFMNDRKLLLNRLFFAISISFFLWTVMSLITWTYIDNSSFLLIGWMLYDIFLGFISISCIYFVQVFLEQKDVSLMMKGVFVALLAPLIVLAPTYANLGGFNITTCDAFQFEGFWYKAYNISLAVLAIIWTIVLLVRKYRTAASDFRKQIVLMGIGIEFFLFSFFTAIFLTEYLTSVGVLPDSSLEFYGLFGMTVFMIFIGILMVRFKTFNVGLIASQALIVALVVLIGSQFTFASSLTNTVLTSVTLVLTGAVGIILIRSVRKEVQQREQLAVANKGQENLIHVMNHQIKGYLGTARNIFAELSQSDDYGQMPETSKPLLNKGLEEMTAGVDYVQQILKGASAHSGTLPYDMRPIDLKSLVVDLASKQKEDAEKAGLSFESTIADGDYTMSGDAIMLEEAFKNLMTNAILYNNPNGSIVVTLSRTDQKILFSVKDTGRGITKDDEKRLFKPGGMGKDSIKFNTKASGYGLALVKPVIEKHQGKIWYETEVGKGTTFFVELPIEQTPKG